MDKKIVETSESEKEKNAFQRFFERLQTFVNKYQIAIPHWLYIVFFVLNNIVIIVILQAGVQQGIKKQVFEAVQENMSRMFTGIWERLDFILLLNFFIAASIYALLLILTNRFWITSMILISVSVIISIIEYIKISVRNEAILPADLNFLQSDTGNISTFLPPNAGRIVCYAIVALILLIIIFTTIHCLDKNHGKVVWFERKDLRYGVRGAIFVTIFGLFASYVGFVGTVDSPANSFSQFMGDKPAMWDSAYDAQLNGPLVAFMRQVNPKIMAKPENYSEGTMKEVFARYEKQAKKINASRKNKINDTTLITILSESFSDPSRIPGLSFNKNVIPFIDNLKKNTDSGLMLSSGYGGGTANLEYMAMTGLSMVNFDPSLTSPYQQLIPKSNWTPTINQYWNNGKDSVAFHPYEPSMYLRAKNYKKFGFTKFYSLRKPDIIKYTAPVDLSPYVSDKSAYNSVLEDLKKRKNPSFIQLVTMQNHMPYNDWYKNNEFKVSSTDNNAMLGEEETSIIQTYAKGANYTDKATEEFFNQLDKLDKPITVLFYGDHLPGAYSTASANKNNSLILHLTDYFIWSNKAARESVKSSNKHSVKSNVYSSPNFFVAQIARHMNAKVSPYIAFLTQLHNHISAMEPPVVNTIQGWDRIPEGQPIYLDKDGRPISYKDMDAKTKQLLDDYKLIQYDITAGKHYLKNMNFLSF